MDRSHNRHGLGQTVRPAESVTESTEGGMGNLVCPRRSTEARASVAISVLAHRGPWTRHVPMPPVPESCESVKDLDRPFSTDCYGHFEAAA